MSQFVKTVPIQLDKERHLRLTIGDAMEFRRRTMSDERPKGISLLRGDLNGSSLIEEDWLNLFQIMLRHEDPELTVAQLGEIMDFGSFVRAAEAFEELLREFAATGEDTGKADPTKSTVAPQSKSSGS